MPAEPIVTRWPLPPMTQTQLDEVQADFGKLLDENPHRYPNIRRMLAAPRKPWWKRIFGA